MLCVAFRFLKAEWGFGVKSFMVMTFAVLAVAFYELSGGSDFEPRAWRAAPEPALPMAAAASEPATTEAAAQPDAVVQTASFAPDVQASEPVVTRASLNLTDIVDEPAPSKEDIFDVSSDAQTETAPVQERPRSATSEETAALLEQFPASETPEISLPSLESAIRRNIAGVAGQDALRDIRTVTGSVVNMRAGPGTGYDVVGQLAEGDTVEILEDSGAGWVRLKALGSDATGWMATFLLSEG